MKRIRLGIVGDRRITSRNKVVKAFQVWVKQTKDCSVDIVTGDCPRGVDALVRAYFRPHVSNIHVADWHGRGKQAGPERNTRLANDVDQLIAIVTPKSKGTWDTYRKVRALGKRTLLVHMDRRAWVLTETDGSVSYGRC